MIKEKNREDMESVSVVVQNSDDNQWKAFQYGLKKAAEDQGVELCVVGTDDDFTLEEQKNLIEQEIAKGTDGILVQPIPGKESVKMLKKIEKKVPVMLIEYDIAGEKDEGEFPLIQPNHYAMGSELAKELLKDYNGNLQGKTFGFVTQRMDSQAFKQRFQGFTETLQGSGIEYLWTVTQCLEEQPKVDFVIALDDSSLIQAGETARANNLHGVLIYGIGKSTEAVYYLDIGIVSYLIVPDEFNMGYEGVTEMSKKIKHSLYKIQGKEVSYTALRHEDLFSKENQELLFIMSQ